MPAKSSHKQKRKVWSVKEKREVLAYAKLHGNTAAINKYECTESSFYEWRKDSRVNSKEKVEGIRKKGGGRKPVLDVGAETKVVSKIRERRTKGLKVRTRQVKKWARDAAESEGKILQASNGWFDKFKKRNDVNVRSPNLKPLKLTTEVLNDCEQFQCKVIDIEKRKDVKWVINYDETYCMKWMEDGKGVTLDKSDNNKCKAPKGERDRFTTVLAAAMNVENLTVKKAPAFIIFKQKKVPRKEAGAILVMKPNVKFTAQEKAWMDRPRMKEYCDMVLIPFLKSLDGHKLLTFDNLDSHVHLPIVDLLRDKVKDITILPLPKNASEVMQMCDLSMNRSFKSNYKQLQGEWYDNQADRIEKGTQENFYSVTKKLILEWISNALKDVPDSVVVNGFKKAGLGLAKDGSEDDDVQWKQVQHCSSN
ncbi:hypothetical protein C9374_006533 [Naegleria lovaniensis]|uniref:HTH CENPB-type domain-containing protein n=1 Tax=Naegleria lovaniensis TaxID=51637 RepID=A0AA88KH95_NAELO|nr:uncharacterized protein C9374_006533 [Naegleria lovaniensis]KAG2381544.1 hypothetical protein C9374_006533 [Naegleria lovaniensis]